MGHVVKHSLEVRRDERGWVIDPVVCAPAGLRLGHVHLASLAPSAVRGNHVHSDASEFILVWGGTAEVVWEEDGRTTRDEVGGGREITVYEIPPGVAHAVTNTGTETVYLMAYYFGTGEEWPEANLKRIA